PNNPLYPFGYGLSYSTFEIESIELSKDKLSLEDEIEVRVTVTNTSEKEGGQTIQLYIQDCYGSIVRPVKELKDFQKVFFKANEMKTISFTINKNKLTYWNPTDGYVAEKGKFNLFIGFDSMNLHKKTFELI